MTFAIVPVKRLSDAKARLAAAMSPALRKRLVLAMLHDVLAALDSIPAITRVLVVTPDRRIAVVAAEHGAVVVPEPKISDLNAAVRRGLDAAAAAQCRRALVVPADVPLIDATEIAQLLAAAERASVTLVPAADGDGTNAIVLSLPSAFEPSFGPRSFARHRRAAEAAGGQLRVLEVPGLAHDVDTPADLARLAHLPRYSFLSRPKRTHRSSASDLIAAAANGRVLDADEAAALSDCADLPLLMQAAERSCLAGHGVNVSFSKKVFIPLTKLCRDVCHYCTFAKAPAQSKPAYLTRDAVVAIARAGAAAGCNEALFTLGDKPELRYASARAALAALGHDTTLGYLEECARLVFETTGLLPHLNPGVMDEAWLQRLRQVSVSQGIMLETASERLSARGGPHFGSPDKHPTVRLATIEAAGRAAVPFTTGLLIGIGETRAERIASLLAIRQLHARHGHVQEVIIQNFRAKPGTRMADAAEPSLADHLWTIAVARLILGPKMNIQAPPNLRPEDMPQLIRAGINDWGGVSPVTPDHVNPEAPWPQLDHLAQVTAQAGRTLVERLAVYPSYLEDPESWLDARFRTPVLRRIDGAGFARTDLWAPGSAEPAPSPDDVARVRTRRPSSPLDRKVARALDRAQQGEELGEEEIAQLFAARGPDFTAICAAANGLRRRRNGDEVSYVVNRNINYTNICTYGCRFCAFSKGRHALGHRDEPYDLSLDEVALRTAQAWSRGATEVCLQGGIAPRYSGETYLSIVKAVKAGAPDIHVHAFSPLEVWHGATTLGLSLQAYLTTLKAAGLASLPGTAAEILDDDVRAVLCPDKIMTGQWLEVMAAAHAVGLKSTATIMFGHVDGYVHWARHLVRVRELQRRTGGFTEFVPLAFVHMEAPIYLKGRARKGPTLREAVLMHAVARLVLDPLIVNIQASWVKMGPDGAALCLDAGANDLGGVLMNESITRAAGAAHGQELSPIELERLIRGIGRKPRQRTTLYGTPPTERIAAAFAECEVRPMSMMAAE